jgi:hypothetical protein
MKRLKLKRILYFSAFIPTGIAIFAPLFSISKTVESISLLVALILLIVAYNIKNE